MKDLPPQVLAAAITIGLLFLLLFPTAVRAYYALDFNKFKRVTHHLLVVIAPFVFLVHPVYGPRCIPDYLYTDGLTENFLEGRKPLGHKGLKKILLRNKNMKDLHADLTSSADENSADSSADDTAFLLFQYQNSA